MKRSRRSYRSENNGRTAFYRDAYKKTFDFEKALARWLSKGQAKVVDIPTNIDADGNVVDSTATEVVDSEEDN